MKFLCDQCKAKYQIADEKVQGKTLKMKCRKCGHIIEIRATGESAGSVAPPGGANPTMQLSALEDGDLHLPPNKVPTNLGVKPASASKIAPARPGSVRPPAGGGGVAKPGVRAPVGSDAKPSGRSSSGVSASKESAKGDSALASAFSKVASAGSSANANADATSPPRASSDLPAEEWYCAIDGVPVGPIRLTDLRGKYAQGAVTGDSLVWREGFEEWRPLLTLPDLHQLVREEGSVAGHLPRNSLSGGGTARTRSSGTNPGRPSNRPAAATPAASPSRGGGNVIPFVARQGGAAARKIDDLPEHEDDEVTRIAEAPFIPPADAGAAALAKAGFAGAPSEPKIHHEPLGSKSPGAFLAAGGAGSLGTNAAAGPDFETTGSGRTSIIDGFKAKAKGISVPMVALMCAATLLVGVSMAVVLVKPKTEIQIQKEIQTQVVHEPGQTIYVPVAASTTAEPSASAAAPKVASAGGGGGGGSTAPAAPVATEAAPTKPAIVDHGPKPPGDPDPPGPPDPGSGGGGGEALSGDDVSRVVGMKKMGIRRRCVDSGPGVGDGVALTLLLDIQPNGTVASVVPTQTKGDSGIGACLAREARGWTFPTSGKGLKVNVPFIFAGGG